MTTSPAYELGEMVDSLLEETFEAQGGIYTEEGGSLFETLDRVTATEASALPCPGGHPIAAQVAHVILYLDTIGVRMGDGRPPRIDWDALWTQDWSVDEIAWEMLRADLRRAYAVTREIVRGFDNVWNPDFRLWILGSIVHTAYHLGIIRQSLATVRAA